METADRTDQRRPKRRVKDLLSAQEFRDEFRVTAGFILLNKVTANTARGAQVLINIEPHPSFTQKRAPPENHLEFISTHML
jgi:hypothetical protein